MRDAYARCACTYCTNCSAWAAWLAAVAGADGAAASWARSRVCKGEAAESFWCAVRVVCGLAGSSRRRRR